MADVSINKEISIACFIYLCWLSNYLGTKTTSQALSTTDISFFVITLLKRVLTDSIIAPLCPNVIHLSLSLTAPLSTCRGPIGHIRWTPECGLGVLFVKFSNSCTKAETKRLVRACPIFMVWIADSSLPELVPLSPKRQMLLNVTKANAIFKNAFTRC